MARILEHKTEGVTLGVLDKDLRLEPELQSVTFVDDQGAVHTIHAHKDGPFGDPYSILLAWRDGTLHTHRTHAEAVQHFTLHGDNVTASRVQPLVDQEAQQTADEQEGE